MENDVFVSTQNQKDSQVNDTHFAFEKPLKDITQNDVLQNVAEKVKKIHAAVYMVARYIPVEDPLHFGVKKTSADILNILFVKDILDPVLCSALFMNTVVYLDKLVTEIEIASVAGYITLMNRNVLVKALSDIRENITSYALVTMQNASYSAPYVPDAVAYFKLESEMFSAAETLPSVPKKTPVEERIVSDLIETKRRDEINKQIDVLHEQAQAHLTDKIESINQKDKTTFAPTSTQVAPKNDSLNDRQDRVIKLLSRKAIVTINDITNEVSGVSEKTIQRDLVDLMQKGIILREGNKRWSTYKLVRPL